MIPKFVISKILDEGRRTIGATDNPRYNPSKATTMTWAAYASGENFEDGED